MAFCFARRANRAEGENVTLFSSGADKRKEAIQKLYKSLKGHWGKGKFKSSQVVLVTIEGKEVPGIINTRHPTRSTNGTRYEVILNRDALLNDSRKLNPITEEEAPTQPLMVRESDLRAVPSFREGERVFLKTRDGNQVEAAIAESYMGTHYDVQPQEGELQCNVEPSMILRDTRVPVSEHNLEYAHGKVKIKIERAKNLPMADSCGTKPGDPYCELYDRKGRLITSTQPITSTVNPHWNHEEIVSIANTDLIFVVIKDTDMNCFGDCSARNEVIAKGFLDMENGLSNLVQFGTFHGSLPLVDVSPFGKVSRCGEIFLNLELQNDILTRDLNKWEITRTRFRSTTNNSATLYQSAYVGDYWNEKLAPITIYEGSPLAKKYIRENCWEDIHASMLEATEFIYVYGWSVDPTMQLIRQLPPTAAERLSKEGVHFSKLEDGTIGVHDNLAPELLAEVRRRWDCTLGAILKKKAGEGVKVCIMIWDEDVAGVAAAGTGSSACRDYFRGTTVQVRCMKRDVQSTFLSNSLTHHQKGVILDAPSSTKKRRLVGFIGGIDLTGGRWDCPGKYIFKIHHHDMYQMYASQGDKKIIRQPWADIHSKVEGPVVYDAVANFHNRWTAQKGGKGLIKINKTFISKEDAALNTGLDAWNAQLFRSIDTTSDHGVTGIEADCQRAWVDVIERSERFIYIENQYFIGSSEMWLGEKSHGGASNIIPESITKRIQQAIRKNEEYCAYILIPLFPEGTPAGAVVQELLRWQKNTIQAMYHAINKTIKSSKSQAHPRDYLQFFAAGTKEPLTTAENAVLQRMVPQGSLLTKYNEIKNMINNRRCPIYIHSKMILVDDEYIILGSANVNDRSMSGNRDTEIAVGLCQPHFTGSNAKGSIKAFRQSLWCEHMGLYGTLPEVIDKPESMACVRFVRERTEQAWNEYCGKGEQCCHLMAYPYLITKDGKLGLGKRKQFPDFPGASILGKDSILPDHMTA
eukprot:TRINITY_DN7857_c0_g1_i1.p1 TRINITY_DN7857_c0_g1~~TRINITY_DN7857_c0_g1_i1.p1  ORF type:complete len:1004 (+),score=169.49 TRINITY_DN7857_c0_g1_i1:83-3013(+)